MQMLLNQTQGMGQEHVYNLKMVFDDQDYIGTVDNLYTVHTRSIHSAKSAMHGCLKQSKFMRRWVQGN